MAILCPFSGREIEFLKLGQYWQAQSRWGWKSRLFARASEVREWAAKMSAEPSEIVEIYDPERFMVRGPGWFSDTFQFREQAEFWRSHRDGKPLDGAKRPTRIEVIGVREEPPEDPMEDARDLVKLARESIAENQARKDREERAS